MMENGAADQMADSFASSGLVNSLSDHDSTSPRRLDVQPLVSMGPADLQHDLDEDDKMDEGADGDSGTGSLSGLSSLDVDNHEPSGIDAAGYSQASGAARPTITSPAGPLSFFFQDIDPRNVPEQSRFDVSVVQQSRSEGVRYGGPEDVEALAERLVQIKRRTDVQGQEGILLEETRPLLRVENESYRENSEYDRVIPLGEGSSGVVHLIRDRQSRRNAVEKMYGVMIENKLYVASLDSHIFALSLVGHHLQSSADIRSKEKQIPLKEFNPNEPIIWCRLKHPYIVQFLGLSRKDSKVMYFSHYDPGFQTLQLSMRLELKQALVLTWQLLEALKYLHKNGIVHNDIQVGNILINESLDKISLNPLQRVKMIDFGGSVKIEAIDNPQYDGRWDVWCAIRIWIRFLGGCPRLLDYDKKEPQTVPVPANTDQRVRTILQWAINDRPTAVEVLDKIESLLTELDSVSSAVIHVTGPPTI